MNLEEKIIKEATQVEAGKKIYECKNCDYCNIDNGVPDWYCDITAELHEELDYLPCKQQKNEEE